MSYYKMSYYKMSYYTWADKISAATNPEELHTERFQFWRNFITEYCQNTGATAIYEQPTFPPESFGAKIKGAFSKIRLEKNNTPEVIFDASFGSIDPTSDLDVGVISATTTVLEEWIKYLLKNNKNCAQEYDSNFYFDKGKYTDNNLYSIVQLHIEQCIPNKLNIIEIQKLIETYANAYIDKTNLSVGIETKKPITISSETSETSERVWPNPMSKDFNEIEQYKTMLHVVESFKEVKDQNMALEVAKYACCKTEGLLCVPSLIICGVFGKRSQDRLQETEGSWRLIVAYEFLWNLRMHKHRDEGKTFVKSKYVRRLHNTLKLSVNTCHNIEKQVDNRIKGIESKEIMLETIYPVINAIIQDELNDKTCNLTIEDDPKDPNLLDLIVKLGKKIKGEPIKGEPLKF